MMNEALYEQIAAAQQQMEQARLQVQALRQQLQPEPISDYYLTDTRGQAVWLSALLPEGGELLVIHNMGQKCNYCTLWADGLSSVAGHIQSRVPLVLVSPDEPAAQKQFAESRGWAFTTLSAAGTSFIADLGFEPQPGKYWPGVSALVKKEGKLYRVGKDLFGPGDLYCNVWHLFDLLPQGARGWRPQLNY